MIIICLFILVNLILKKRNPIFRHNDASLLYDAGMDVLTAQNILVMHPLRFGRKSA